MLNYKKERNKIKLRENPDLGRKVFFLNPPVKLESRIIPELRTEEYEIYIIKDYHYIKNLLRIFPTSICFININDKSLDSLQWFKFIRFFSEDPTLKETHLGVVTSESISWIKELFLLHTQLPCGYNPLNKNIEELKENFTALLDINGAKGKRKFVRADCKNDSNIFASCVVKGITVQMHVENISTVGFCCTAPLSGQYLFQVNSVVRKLSLVINNKEIICNTAVIIKKKGTKKLLLVFLFLQGFSYTSKTIIRDYITNYLQHTIHLIQTNLPLDTQDYSVLLKEEYDIIKSIKASALYSQRITTQKQEEEFLNYQQEWEAFKTMDEITELHPIEGTEKDSQSSHDPLKEEYTQTFFDKDDIQTTDLF
ncbi:MAG: hypothetical protein BKP49_04225 [Treponema sp. CETP13]|nr:MAG: hypothetical protein BKP49_04225 [Treponema sp. CETP13]